MGSQVVAVAVDVHEPEGIRRELTRLGAEVTEARLPIGDYATGRLAVERKTVRDLHLTLVAGRLWGQLGRLRATGKRPFLLIEGRRLDRGPVSPPAIRGAILAAAENGVTVLRSETEDDSALWLYRLACREERSRRPVDRPLHAQRPKPTGPEGVLAAIPGISVVSARALLTRFGSIAAVVEAADVDLTGVHGIGPVRAQRLREALTHQPVVYRSRRSRERQGRAT